MSQLERGFSFERRQGYSFPRTHIVWLFSSMNPINRLDTIKLLDNDVINPSMILSNVKTIIIKICLNIDENHRLFDKCDTKIE